MSEFRGFSQTAKPESEPTAQNTAFSCGLTALQSGNLEESFLCFSQLPNCPGALFNLALCYCKVQLYEKALGVLERAEKELSTHGPLPAQNTAVPKAFLQQDVQGDGYRMPMAQQMPTLLPAQARLRVLRLMADIYGELGYKQEFLRILPTFSGKDYGNIAKIKEKFGEKKNDNE